MKKMIFSLAILCLGSLFMMVSTAGITDGPFELDGNAVSYEKEDWDKLFNGESTSFHSFSNVVADPHPMTIYIGGGSKDREDVSSWAHTSGSVPDKDEILNAYAASYVDDNDQVYVYFGSDRYSNDGDAAVGFWFFQESVGALPIVEGETRGAFSGVHRTGDLLILSNYGSSQEIEVWKWIEGIGGADGSVIRIYSSEADGSEPAKCNPLLDQSVCAITNQQTETAPWPYQAKQPDETRTTDFPNHSFLEGGIVLNEFFTDKIPCFSSFLAVTRTSSSINAQLKDFVAGEFRLCTIGVTVDCYDSDVNSAGDGFLYKYNVSISNEGFGVMNDLSVKFGETEIHTQATLTVGETKIISKTFDSFNPNTFTEKITAVAYQNSIMVKDEADPKICPNEPVETGILAVVQCNEVRYDPENKYVYTCGGSIENTGFGVQKISDAVVTVNFVDGTTDSFTVGDIIGEEIQPFTTLDFSVEHMEVFPVSNIEIAVASLNHDQSPDTSAVSSEPCQKIEGDIGVEISCGVGSLDTSRTSIVYPVTITVTNNGQGDLWDILVKYGNVIVENGEIAFLPAGASKTFLKEVNTLDENPTTLNAYAIGYAAPGKIDGYETEYTHDAEPCTFLTTITSIEGHISCLCVDYVADDIDEEYKYGYSGRVDNTGFGEETITFAQLEVFFVGQTNTVTIDLVDVVDVVLTHSHPGTYKEFTGEIKSDTPVEKLKFVVNATDYLGDEKTDSELSSACPELPLGIDVDIICPHVDFAKDNLQLNYTYEIILENIGEGELFNVVVKYGTGNNNLETIAIIDVFPPATIMRYSGNFLTMEQRQPTETVFVTAYKFPGQDVQYQISDTAGPSDCPPKEIETSIEGEISCPTVRYDTEREYVYNYQVTITNTGFGVQTLTEAYFEVYYVNGQTTTDVQLPDAVKYAILQPGSFKTHNAEFDADTPVERIYLVVRSTNYDSVEDHHMVWSENCQTIEGDVTVGITCPFVQVDDYQTTLIYTYNITIQNTGDGEVYDVSVTYDGEPLIFNPVIDTLVPNDFRYIERTFTSTVLRDYTGIVEVVFYTYPGKDSNDKVTKPAGPIQCPPHDMSTSIEATIACGSVTYTPEEGYFTLISGSIENTGFGIQTIDTVRIDVFYTGDGNDFLYINSMEGTEILPDATIPITQSWLSSYPVGYFTVTVITKDFDGETDQSSVNSENCMELQPGIDIEIICDKGRVNEETKSGFIYTYNITVTNTGQGELYWVSPKYGAHEYPKIETLKPGQIWSISEEFEDPSQKPNTFEASVIGYRFPQINSEYAVYDGIEIKDTDTAICPEVPSETKIELEMYCRDIIYNIENDGGEYENKYEGTIQNTGFGVQTITEAKITVYYFNGATEDIFLNNGNQFDISPDDSWPFGISSVHTDTPVESFKLFVTHVDYFTVEETAEMDSNKCETMSNGINVDITCPTGGYNDDFTWIIYDYVITVANNGEGEIYDVVVTYDGGDTYIGMLKPGEYQDITGTFQSQISEDYTLPVSANAANYPGGVKDVYDSDDRAKCPVKNTDPSLVIELVCEDVVYFPCKIGNEYHNFFGGKIENTGFGEQYIDWAKIVIKLVGDDTLYDFSLTVPASILPGNIFYIPPTDEDSFFNTDYAVEKIHLVVYHHDYNDAYTTSDALESECRRLEPEILLEITCPIPIDDNGNELTRIDSDLRGMTFTYKVLLQNTGTGELYNVNLYLEEEGGTDTLLFGTQYNDNTFGPERKFEKTYTFEVTDDNYLDIQTKRVYVTAYDYYTELPLYFSITYAGPAECIEEPVTGSILIDIDCETVVYDTAREYIYDYKGSITNTGFGVQKITAASIEVIYVGGGSKAVTLDDYIGVEIPPTGTVLVNFNDEVDAGIPVLKLTLHVSTLNLDLEDVNGNNIILDKSVDSDTCPEVNHGILVQIRCDSANIDTSTYKDVIYGYTITVQNTGEGELFDVVVEYDGSDVITHPNMLPNQIESKTGTFKDDGYPKTPETFSVYGYGYDSENNVGAHDEADKVDSNAAKVKCPDVTLETGIQTTIDCGSSVDYTYEGGLYSYTFTGLIQNIGYGVQTIYSAKVKIFYHDGSSEEKDVTVSNSVLDPMTGQTSWSYSHSSIIPVKDIKLYVKSQNYIYVENNALGVDEAVVTEDTCPTKDVSIKIDISCPVVIINSDKLGLTYSYNYTIENTGEGELYNVKVLYKDVQVGVILPELKPGDKIADSGTIITTDNINPVKTGVIGVVAYQFPTMNPPYNAVPYKLYEEDGPESCPDTLLVSDFTGSITCNDVYYASGYVNTYSGSVYNSGYGKITIEQASLEVYLVGVVEPVIVAVDVIEGELLPGITASFSNLQITTDSPVDKLKLVINAKDFRGVDMTEEKFTSNQCEQLGVDVQIDVLCGEPTIIEGDTKVQWPVTITVTNPGQAEIYLVTVTYGAETLYMDHYSLAPGDTLIKTRHVERESGFENVPTLLATVEAFKYPTKAVPYDTDKLYKTSDDTCPNKDVDPSFTAQVDCVDVTYIRNRDYVNSYSGSVTNNGFGVQTVTEAKLTVYFVGKPDSEAIEIELNGIETTILPLGSEPFSGEYDSDIPVENIVLSVTTSDYFSNVIGPQTYSSECEQLFSGMYVNITCDDAVVDDSNMIINYYYHFTVKNYGESEIYLVTVKYDGIEVDRFETFFPGEVKTYYGNFSHIDTKRPTGIVDVTGYKYPVQDAEYKISASSGPDECPDEPIETSISSELVCDTGEIDNQNEEIKYTFHGKVSNNGFQLQRIQSVKVYYNNNNNVKTITLQNYDLLPGDEETFNGEIRWNDILGDFRLVVISYDYLLEEVKSDITEDLCYVIKPDASIEITKGCTVIKEQQDDGTFRLQIEASGQVCNNGGIRLKDVVLGDDKGITPRNTASDWTESVGYLDINECYDYSFKYYPTEFFLADTFKNTITATAQRIIWAQEVSDWDDAICWMSGGGCPECPVCER